MNVKYKYTLLVIWECKQIDVTMKKTAPITLLIVIITIVTSYAQQHKTNSLTSNTIKLDSTNYVSFIKNLPSFSMFGDYYLITGTSTKSNAFTSTGSDAKFEIGFKQRINNLNLPFNIFPFFTYRQKAFWDVYRESLPFRELNYNPGFGVAKLFFNKQGFNYALYASFEHESNGRDEENSRTWNFLALTFFKPIDNTMQLRAKTWLPVGKMEGNEDILSYRGFFNVGLTYKAHHKLFFDIDLQPAYDTKLQGNVKAGVSFRLSKNSNQFLYLQYFGGYSEDLINYNQSVSNIRIGFIIKDLIFNFKD